jgi:hypothetical protein
VAGTTTARSRPLFAASSVAAISAIIFPQQYRLPVRLQNS